MHKHQVHIVDDDPVIRIYLENILNSDGIPTRAHSSAEEFLEHHQNDIASCLILDLEMPGMKGLELIEWMKARRIETPIIVLSADNDIPAVVESIRRGATDFIEKPPVHDVLIQKVRQLLESDSNRLQASAELREILDRFATLTEREKEVVEMLITGLSSKQIAKGFGISVKTVHNHRSNVLAKTRAMNVASLVRMRMMVGNHFEAA